MTIWSQPKAHMVEADIAAIGMKTRMSVNFSRR